MASCFLGGGYQAELPPGALDDLVIRLERAAQGGSVRLVRLVGVPTDETVFAVFSATSAEAVAEACRCAGRPADRLSAALEAAPGPERRADPACDTSRAAQGRRETPDSGHLGTS